MQHLEEGEIHAWLDGALSEAEGARIEQHAASCKECAAMVADARGLIAGAARIVSALDHVPAGVIPKSGAAAAPSRPLWRALRLTPFRAAMAASLIVAAGSLIVVQRRNADLMVPHADQVMEVRAAASAPAATPAPTAPPVDSKAKRADASAANEARQLEEPKTRALEQSTSKTTLALSDSTLLMKPAPASPAPAPKVVAEDQRAKKERDSVLASVVVTAAPASAVGRGARSAAQAQAQQGQTGAQGQIAAREPARDSVGASADIAFRRALPPAVLRAEAAANTGFANFLGCYQVVDSAAWPRSLPVAFAIVRDSARVHLIRPGVGQRPAIGRWQNTSPSSAAITLDGPTSASFTLTQTGTEIVATTPSAPTIRVRVVRAGCAP